MYGNSEQNIEFSDFFASILSWFDVVVCPVEAARHPEVSAGCLQVFTDSVYPIPHTRAARDGRRNERHPAAPIFRLPLPPRTCLSRTMFILYQNPKKHFCGDVAIRWSNVGRCIPSYQALVFDIRLTQRMEGFNQRLDIWQLDRSSCS